ncbi:CPBP family intramembrane glutamic endopeptidase [Plebeiibacterium marinum]|uniref:CPBP family intramembrane metalloprotease n=1 Tax=Plebeiibacterium marinum TaxID=2992111 RepID=A0AAE3MFT7_9BACT|nr:type II CAAX endopeptidase family protein [Plebeiobacterium marinum]MCW3806921.1 CPBP family intramembrane metalloprotease [Plebeiobacterium marinum]
MEELNKNHYPGISQSWGIVGIAILAQIVLAPVYMGVINPMGKELAMLFYYILTIGGAFAFAHYIRKRDTGLDSYPIKGDSVKLIVLISVFTLAVGVGVTDPVTSLIPMPDFFIKAFAEMMGEKGIFAFMTIAIAAPVLEELIFRGVILDGLLKTKTPQKAILFSSFLFAFLHLNPWQFIAAMVIGSFAGYIYYKTHNLLLCIIIHFINNSTAFLMGLFFNAEEEIGQSLVDVYGSATNVLFVVGGGIIISAISMFLIIKEFKTRNIEV